LDLIQLEAGALAGELLTLRVGPLQLLRLRVNRGLHGRGVKPLGRQIVALDLEPWRHPRPLVAHGQRLTTDCLFGLAAEGGIHLSTGGPCTLAILSIDRERFRSWASALGCPEPVGAFDANWLAVAPPCGRGPGAPGGAGPQRGGRSPGRGGRVPARIELVKAAQAWMEAHPTEPITLDALCRHVHAGRRSLIQGFREHLGMGPMAYLKRQRLHGARRRLLASDPAVISVALVAQEFGFLNAGHFAVAYRQLFGERPSVTLNGGSRLA
jgi:AraC family ethanolamine operon transcriptional activator